MATLLDIDLGDRRLENFGQVARPDLSTGHLRNNYRISIPNPTHERAAMADAVKANGHAVSRALLDVAGVIDRVDEREAQYAVAQAENYMINGLDGQDQVNENGETVHVPGIFERNPEELHNAGTDVVKETEKLRKSVREQDFYKKLSYAQRSKFDRAFAFKEDAFLRQAANVHGKNVIERKKIIDQKTLALKQAEFDKMVGADDVQYVAALNNVSTHEFVVSQGTAIKNPEVFDNGEVDIFTDEGFDQIKWEGGPLSEEQKAAKKEELQAIAAKYTRRRMDIFLDLASKGQALPNEYLDTPDKLLKFVELQADALNYKKSEGTEFADGEMSAVHMGDAERAEYQSKIERARQTYRGIVEKREHDGREVFRNSITSQVQEILKNGSKGEETIKSLSDLSTALHQKTLPEAALFNGHEMEYDAVLNYVDGRLHSEQNNYKANKKSAQDALLQGGKDHFAAVEDRIRRMADEVHQGRKDGESADDFQTRQYLTMGMIGKYRQLDGYDVKFADEMEKLAATIANDQETEALVMIDQAFGVANDYNPQAKQSIAQIKEMYKQVTAKNGDLYVNGVEINRMLDGTKGFNYWRMREQLRAAMNALPQGVDRIEAAKQWIAQKKQTATAENAFTSMRSIAETLGITSKLEGDAETDAWFENAQKIISEYDKALKAISK